MKLKHFILLSLANIRINKRFTVISTAIISLCILLCIVVNCVSDSFDAWSISLTYKKECHTFCVDSNTLTLDDFRDIEHVTYVGEDYPNTFVGITDSSLNFAEKGDYIDNYAILLTSYYDNIIPEVIAGETIKEGMRNVALIPDRFQPSVYYNFSGYFKPNAPLLKGEDFIGETITYIYSVLKDYGKPPTEDNWIVYTYSFKVIGVYDILKYGNSDTSMVYVPLDDMREPYLNSKLAPGMVQNVTNYSIVVDNSDNVSYVEKCLLKIRERIIQNAIQNHTDDFVGSPTLKANPTHQLEKSTTIKKAVQTISIALLVFLLISIYLLVLSSLNKRKSQIALLKVQGYSFSQITACLILEGVFICLISIAISLLISCLLLIVFWHSILVSFFAIGFETLQISTPFYLKTAALCALIGSLGTVAGVYVASGKVAKIEAAQALKE